MKIQLNSPDSTIDFGKRLAEGLVGGEIITLSGQMGSGKTTLVKGMAQGLGISQTVTSPTFAIMNAYEGRLRLYHFDAYRLGGAEDFFDNGLDEFLNDEGAVAVIEWPQIIAAALKERKLMQIKIEYIEGEKRELTLSEGKE